MKKYATILPVITCLLSSVCLSQASDSVKNKRQKFCSVKLTKMNGSIENFLLGGFSGDSMLGYSFYDDGNKVLIKQQHLVVARSGDIKRVLIKIEKRILVAPNSTVNDTAGIKRIESKLVTDNAKTAVTGYAVGELTEKLWTTTIASPGWDVAFLAFDLLFPLSQKSYAINGNDRRFKKMVKELSPKK